MSERLYVYIEEREPKEDGGMRKRKGGGGMGINTETVRHAIKKTEREGGRYWEIETGT